MMVIVMMMMLMMMHENETAREHMGPNDGINGIVTGSLDL